VILKYNIHQPSTPGLSPEQARVAWQRFGVGLVFRVDVSCDKTSWNRVFM